MKAMIRILAAAAALAVPAVMLPSVATAADVPAIKKIAMVDMQRVLNDTKAGQKARKELETSSKTKQEKLDKMRQKLEGDAGKLKKYDHAARLRVRSLGLAAGAFHQGRERAHAAALVRAASAACMPATRPNTVPMVMPMPAR